MNYSPAEDCRYCFRRWVLHCLARHIRLQVVRTTRLLDARLAPGGMPQTSFVDLG